MTRHGIIILAAGASSRMGKSKISLEVYGQPLLFHIATEAMNTNPSRLIVVTGGHALPDNFQSRFPTAEITFNENWPKGIGGSIRKGVELIADSDLDNFIITTADQPFVSAMHFDAMIEQYREHDKIIASSYSNTLGIPVLFPFRYIPSIKNLPFEEGAKRLLKQHHEDVIALPFKGGEIDLDTPEDYRSFLNSQEPL